jgi:hypothetical protein
MVNICYISGAVEGVIKTTIGDLDKVTLDRGTFGHCGGVHEFSSTHFHRPCFFARIRVDSNDTRCINEAGSLYHTKADCTTTEDSNGGARYSI